MRLSSYIQNPNTYISISVDDHLIEPAGIFYHQPNKIAMRKQFEKRVWRRDEPFEEGMHQKIILANWISIEDDELVDYIIENIPGPALTKRTFKGLEPGPFF